jgi:drug/metabolite transporter (DMT)-like permease
LTFLALVLVLSSAVLHAIWNLAAKRAGSGLPFIWLFTALANLIYAPIAVVAIVIVRPRLGGIELLFILGSAALHLAYFFFLQRGYRLGDLSLVYPLARGTGPVLSTSAAILFFGEQPTPLALAGAVLIAISVFVLTSSGGLRAVATVRTAVGYGLLTGGVIAAYTLWDKYAVSVLLISPLIFDWLNGLGRTALLTPYALRHRADIAREWRLHRREALTVAILSPLAYILVLTALVFTPVSYVAPAREISILVAAIMGARLLAEGDPGRRLVAASGMVVGVVALALG